jgi:hypothetical protein
VGNQANSARRLLRSRVDIGRVEAHARGLAG